MFTYRGTVGCRPSTRPASRSSSGSEACGVPTLTAPSASPFDVPSSSRAARSRAGVTTISGTSSPAVVVSSVAASGEALATDCAWLGPKQAKNVLVLMSGTHGVEGFCGAGALMDVLTTAPALPRGLALLLVHAIGTPAQRAGARSKLHELSVALGDALGARRWSGGERDAVALIAPANHSSARASAQAHGPSVPRVSLPVIRDWRNAVERTAGAT